MNEINAKEFLISFENVLKKSTLINISKGKYRSSNKIKKDNWNIIYDIEGMNYNNFYIPYVKIIFIMNKDITEFTEKSVIISNGRDYLTSDINIEKIFETITTDKLTKEYSNFVVDGLIYINKHTDDPFISLEQKMDESGIQSIDNKHSFFTLSRMDIDYSFVINIKNGINVECNNENKTVKTFNDVFNFLIKIIDKK